MCGRFNLKTESKEIAKVLGFKAKAENVPRFNIAPSQDILIARYDECNQGEIVAVRWGLLPSWVKDPKNSQKPINARADTAPQKPFFRQAFKKRRCLVPANGFYEWRPEGKIKQPFLIHKLNDELFFFAGLFESFISSDGEVIETALILTTDANDKVAQIHNRMPVILPAPYYFPWLNTENTDIDYLSSMLRPYPGDNLEIYPVSTIVNSARNETSACVERLTPEQYRS